MAENPGEHIVGEYLRWIKRCDFVTYNTPTQDEQGEIDVIGVNTSEKKAFVCEVATHMQTGLNYVDHRTREPDNVNRFKKKFSKNIAYTQKAFPGYNYSFMLWTPLIKINKEGSKANQRKDLDDIVASIKSSHGVDIEVVHSRKYYNCLMELKEFAKKYTGELKSPIMRAYQIEGKLKKHLDFNRL